MSLHNKSIIELSPANHLVIEQQHKMLEKYFIDLRDACAYSATDKQVDCHLCDHEKQASCQGRLPSFLFHIIDLAGKHFDHEETIMLNSAHDTEQYDSIRLHQHAHEGMMLKLQGLANECLSLREQDNTLEIYHYFYEKISDLFEKHDRHFDDPFIKST